MAEVVIYTSMLCPYCVRAKKLLQSKGISFEEIDVMMEPRRKPEMVERAGGRTSVPQIFINEEHIGGCDDLMALEATGGLDAKLETRKAS
ncbi:glutaredoxin 3 [Kiloniella laminariae]|uniref:Glutaredoxin n=1 Tax=Kiloniella laminariae TaxID=454162 RepID=A0ABT4LQF2_9PROT|nr:glutaredoxin 3 [Kiloniella laminariae]MCZ4282162.1 glutaredoxin 3 [Kiloniella laminariae]